MFAFLDPGALSARFARDNLAPDEMVSPQLALTRITTHP
jgi:hypothetical protein